MTHKDWLEAFTEYYDHYEKGDVLDKDEAPDMEAEPAYWPRASTVTAFLARVCQHPKRVELTTAAGFSISATAAKALKEQDVDDDVLEQYARAVSKQHAKVDEELKKAAAWPKVMRRRWRTSNYPSRVMQMSSGPSRSSTARSRPTCTTSWISCK